MINKEKIMAKKIKKLLNKRGFLVHQHNSQTSKSVYLKIDKGMLPSMRISDHKRLNNDNCKYNVIKNYNGVRNEIVNGREKKYYNFNNLRRLITDIELERNSKIITIGYLRYKKILKTRINRKTNYNKNKYCEKVA